MVNAAWHQRTGFGVRKVPRKDARARQQHEQGSVTDLPALERDVASGWVRSGLASRSLARKATGPSWTCYVEPLSPAGLPGVTHARVLALADLYPRFRAMQGYDVTVSHGWACHGLGVEMAVARELGLTGQAEVEAYGIEAFAARPPSRP